MACLQQALDFTKNGEPFRSNDSSILHVELRYRDTMVTVGDESVYGDKTTCPASSTMLSPMHLYTYVDDVDAQFAKALAAGATSHLGPEDILWGDCMASFVDPGKVPSC
jgi:uncharacterized glyoxalase superfamily protein PhnB